MRQRTCRECGRRVLFAADANGTIQILDASAPVYSVQLYGQEPEQQTCTRLLQAYVSHFSTCPAASQFSKRKTGSDKQ